MVWMDAISFEKSMFNDDGTVTIPKWAVDRWMRQMQTEYKDLLEQEKESDRIEADRVLQTIKINKDDIMNQKEILKLAEGSSEWLDPDVIAREDVINFFKYVFKIDYVYVVKSQYDYEPVSIEAMYRNKEDAYGHLTKLNNNDDYSDCDNWVELHKII